MVRQDTTIEELIRDFKRRPGADAFQAIFERYYSRVYGFFRRKGFSEEDSRDLTQETFFSVYKGLDGLERENRFEPWMYSVALNLYKDELERRHARKRTADEVSLEEGMDHALRPVASWAFVTQTSPVEAVLEKEKREKLREALGQLPEQMRRCAYLRIVGDLSHQEIAAAMGISVGTVKAHLHQARKTLSEKLRHLFGETEL